jgi:CHAD domain-containing protein
MKRKKNLNLQIYGATILMTHLTALVQESQGVRLGEDIEAIHRMRVASRRLRATLPLFGSALAGKQHLEWIKSIRGITRVLGAARDSDVQIESVAKLLEEIEPPNRSGVRRLLLRLRQERALMQPKILRELTKFEKSGLVAEIAQKLAPYDIYHDRLNLDDVELLRMANRAIHLQLDEFLGFDAIVNQPEKIQELHAMRISAKKLRYTMETFAPLYEDGLKNHLKAMRSAQDSLGSIHDCDVWAINLPVFIEAEKQRTLEYFGTLRPFKRLADGLDYFQEVKSSERDKTYAGFRETWEKWQGEGLWDELGALTHTRLAAAEAAMNTDEAATLPETAAADGPAADAASAVEDAPPG